MTKQAEVMKEVPAFIEELGKAKSESEVAKACNRMKDIVDKVFNKSEGRRDPRTMTAIRKAINERFPIQPVDNEVDSDFPYYFTNSGKGNVNRLQHVAHKYLKDEYSAGTKQLDAEVVQETVEAAPEVKVSDISLESFCFSEEELANVKNAIGEADVKEWLKQAILQRANTINKLRESLDEDWASIPSQQLMEDKRYRTNSAACRELVSRAVRVVKQWNYDHPEQKWCITNKLISELTEITVKAIAKAVEGMDNDSYNKGQGLEPVINRQTKATVGEASSVMSILKVTGAEGSEVHYRPD